jgi:hypothetical protein
MTDMSNDSPLPPIETRKASRARSIVLLAAVFLFGALCGGTGGFMIARRWAPEPFLRGGLQRFAVRRIARQLDLDAAQRAKVQTILRDARERILGLAEKNRPETDEILGQARERIRAELRPEQRERFDRIVGERQERRRSRLGEHAPGPSR